MRLWIRINYIWPDPDTLFPKLDPRVRIQIYIHYSGKVDPRIRIHYSKMWISGAGSGSTSNLFSLFPSLIKDKMSMLFFLRVWIKLHIHQRRRRFIRASGTFFRFQVENSSISFVLLLRHTQTWTEFIYCIGTMLSPNSSTSLILCLHLNHLPHWYYACI